MCRSGLVSVLMASLSISPAFAQARHVVDPSVVAGLVQEQVAAQKNDRAVVRTFLARPDVRTVATSAGIDIGGLEAAIELLSATEAARAAEAATAVEPSLVGGASSITLSTTTIIIGLLLLILIIVAVD